MCTEFIRPEICLSPRLSQEVPARASLAARITILKHRVLYRFRNSDAVSSASSEEQSEEQHLGGHGFTVMTCSCQAQIAEVPQQWLARVFSDAARQVAFDPLDGSSILGDSLLCDQVHLPWCMLQCHV